MSKPEKTFRVGPISASIFVNEAKGKQPFHSVTLQRRYKDGDDWKSSSTFTLRDLPTAIAVLQLAMNHLVVLSADDKG